MALSHTGGGWAPRLPWRDFPFVLSFGLFQWFSNGSERQNDHARISCRIPRVTQSQGDGRLWLLPSTLTLEHKLPVDCWDAARGGTMIPSLMLGGCLGTCPGRRRAGVRGGSELPRGETDQTVRRGEGLCGHFQGSKPWESKTAEAVPLTVARQCKNERTQETRSESPRRVQGHERTEGRAGKALVYFIAPAAGATTHSRRTHNVAGQTQAWLPPQSLLQSHHHLPFQMHLI